jgi:hypothetical protein
LEEFSAYFNFTNSHYGVDGQPPYWRGKWGHFERNEAGGNIFVLSMFLWIDGKAQACKNVLVVNNLGTIF